MAKSRAATDLKKIDGFGDAKAEKYGQRFVSAILEMSGQTDGTGGKPG